MDMLKRSSLAALYDLLLDVLRVMGHSVKCHSLQALMSLKLRYIAKKEEPEFLHCSSIYGYSMRRNEFRS